ncbi:MAG: acyl--CoA ligase, partial [Clostridia bacterium]|nr:acyl--CoA ligase [Clostridia bacterium]
MPLPKCSLYSYLRARNADHTDAGAIHYYGTTITYGTLLANIDRCADAFYAMGVRAGDIVTFISVTTPETVYAMYALNKIGAVSNFVDPRMDTESIFAMIDGAGSDIVVTIDLAFPKLKKIMPRLHLSRVIVQSAGLSLSPVVRFLFNLKQKAPKIPWSDQIIRWAELMQHSTEAAAVEAPYREEETAIITYTGGTTGIPKGVMLTSDSMNAVAMNFAYAGFHY